jgi:potassium large conductance calcium-activated channel subfamily M alpha protein 1
MISKRQIDILEDRRQISLEKLQHPSTNKSETSQYSTILKYYYISSIADIIEIFAAALSFVYPLIFIINTYSMTKISSKTESFELIVGVLMIIDFFWRMYLSESRLSFLFGVSSFYDYISIIPIIIDDVLHYSSRLFNFLRTLRIISCLRLEKFFSRHKLTIMKRAFNLVILVLSLIIIMGGAMIEIENNDYFKNINAGQEGKVKLKVLQFHDIVYFSIVTIGTLGYGDIVPNNKLSKVVVFLEIILVLILLPSSTNKLLDALNARSIYNNQMYDSQKKKHIMLLGFFNGETLKHFLEELYHPDHGTTEIDTVILRNEPPSDEILVLLKLQAYHSKVFYLQGNPLEMESLARAQAHKALCVIILSRKAQDINSVDEDYKIMQWALSIKSFSKIRRNKVTRVCLQVNFSSNKNLYKYVSNRKSQVLDHVTCTEELKLKLIAKNCVCPGIITLIASLLTSSIPELKIGYPYKMDESNKQYAVLHGMQCEMYRIILRGEVFGGILFSDIVKQMYKVKSIILFAIEVEVCDEMRVFVNPSDYLLEYKNYYAYVIDKQMPDIQNINDISVEGVKRKDYCKAREHNIINGMLINKKLLAFKSTGNFLGNNFAHRTSPISFSIAKSIDIMKIKLKKHIIICGFVQDIDILIAALRPKIFGDKIAPVVILTTDSSIKKEWDKIRIYDEVYFIKGSALNIFDLKRARIQSAKVAVILPKKEDQGKSVENTSNSFDQESETIFIYKAIKNVNPKIRIITEIKDICNINYLLGVKDESNLRKYGFWATDPLAYGELYLPYFLDTIICQSFYNPFVEQIVDQFIMGSANTHHLQQEIHNKIGLFECSLFLFNPPRNIKKIRFFGEIFLELVTNHKMITLAIFKKICKDSKPVLISNPPADEIVGPNDNLFVLYQHEPTIKYKENYESSQSNNDFLPEDIKDKKFIIKKNYNALLPIKTGLSEFNQKIEAILTKFDEPSHI